MPSLPGTAPPSCGVAKAGSSTGIAFYERRAAMFDCLANWTSGILFTGDIGSSPRLGFVPKIAELGLCKTQPNPAPPVGGCSGALPKHVHVNNFAPVYIDGVYFGNESKCDTDNPATPPASTTKWVLHSPGKRAEWIALPVARTRSPRMSGVVVPCGSLPQEICDTSPSGPFPDGAGITRVRLSSDRAEPCVAFEVGQYSSSRRFAGIALVCVVSIGAIDALSSSASDELGDRGNAIGNPTEPGVTSSTTIVGPSSTSSSSRAPLRHFSGGGHHSLRWMMATRTMHLRRFADASGGATIDWSIDPATGFMGTSRRSRSTKPETEPCKRPSMGRMLSPITVNCKRTGSNLKCKQA